MTRPVIGWTVRVLGPIPPSLAALLTAAGLFPVACTESFTTWAPGAPPSEEDQS